MNAASSPPLLAPLSVTNIAAYRFAPLDELAALRSELLACCRSHGLRGTILLSGEGINLFVAGNATGVDALLARLRSIAALAQLQARYSYTAHQPFRRMLVRIKKEIIAFGVPGIEPARRTSLKLAPRQLKAWLDEGRPLTLLDTRNDYEVKLGTFENALPVGVDHFRDFPAALAKLPAELKDRTIVMFCTGGIRCEKAGPYMESQGFRDVLQLDGGILKYFEECGGAHYRGECFVFDQRVGIDRGGAAGRAFRCRRVVSVVLPQRSGAGRAAAAQPQPGDPRGGEPAAGQRAGGDIPSAACAAGL